MFKGFQSLWHFVSVSSALLPRRLWNFKAIRVFQQLISRFGDCVRSTKNISSPILKRGADPLFRREISISIVLSVCVTNKLCFTHSSLIVISHLEYHSANALFTHVSSSRGRNDWSIVIAFEKCFIRLNWQVNNACQSNLVAIGVMKHKHVNFKSYRCAKVFYPTELTSKQCMSVQPCCNWSYEAQARQFQKLPMCKAIRRKTEQAFSRTIAHRANVICCTVPDFK